MCKDAKDQRKGGGGIGANELHVWNNAQEKREQHRHIQLFIEM